jgi:osmotically-inducible protein OsmY
VAATTADPAGSKNVSDVDVSEPVKTARQINAANRIARAAEGVHAVHDERTLSQ